jgi:hypothetical protein
MTDPPVRWSSLGPVVAARGCHSCGGPIAAVPVRPSLRASGDAVPVRRSPRTSGDVVPVRRSPGERGQASVELAVLAPLLVVVALAAAQLLAAGAAAALADHAAEAGAVALLQGTDPTAAARAAVPGWSRRGMKVEVAGRQVHVRLRPPAPISALGELLEAGGKADAGPSPP